MAETPKRTRTRRAVPANDSTSKAPVSTVSALDALTAEINDSFGMGTARKGTEITDFRLVETGVFPVDLALLGGMPESMTNVFVGWESSGKTTMAMRHVAAVQRKYPNRKVMWVDAEGTFSPAWAERHGVNREQLVIVQPPTAEQTVDIIYAAFTKTGDEVSLVVVDSIPALVPSAESEKSAEDVNVAARARLVGRLCSKIYSAQHAYPNERYPNAGILFINQWRNKIGVIMGDPRVMPGGNQPKFMSAVTMEFKNKEFIGKDGDEIEEVSHNEHSFKVMKNKAGNSVRTGHFRMVRASDGELPQGTIDDYSVALTFAKRMGYYGGGGKTWRCDTLPGKVFGKAGEIREYMIDNPADYLVLKQVLLMHHRVKQGLPMTPPDNYLLGDVHDDTKTFVRTEKR